MLKLSISFRAHNWKNLYKISYCRHYAIYSNFRTTWEHPLGITFGMFHERAFFTGKREDLTLEVEGYLYLSEQDFIRLILATKNFHSPFNKFPKISLISGAHYMKKKRRKKTKQEGVTNRKQVSLVIPMQRIRKMIPTGLNFSRGSGSLNIFCKFRIFYF